MNWLVGHQCCDMASISDAAGEASRLFFSMDGNLTGRLPNLHGGEMSRCSIA
jgi:hypothetical protein